MPVPYPNIAKTATAKQKGTGGVTVSVPGTSVGVTGSVASKQTGVTSSRVKGRAEFISYSSDVKLEGRSVARSLDAVTHNRHTEAAQLRNMLNDLNRKLQTLPADRAEDWQAVLENYAVTASALYVTIKDDDD